MELLCPECLAPLVSVDGQTARCTAHGGEFQVLFTRAPLPLPVAAGAPTVALHAAAVCAQHPAVPATCTCQHCGAAICGTCDFPQPDGGHLCPACARQQAEVPPLISPGSTPAAGVRCVQHSNVPATAQCKLCGAFMCRTCTFDLPGGVKVCPACATATPKLSPKRKRLMIGSFALAIWCTIVMTALFGGIFRGLVTNKEDEEVLGLALTFLLLVPSITGVALGVSAMDRRMPNSIAMWIATVWNGVILGGFILLMIVGMMK